MSALQILVDRVLARCRARGQIVAQTLALFIAKHVLLEKLEEKRVTESGLHQELNSEEVANLIEDVTSRLLETNHPSLETVRMQVAFEEALRDQELRLEFERSSKQATLEKIFKHVNSLQIPRDKLVQDVYDQIFSYVVAFVDRYEEPAEQKAQTDVELKAKFEEVVSRPQLRKFVSQPADVKEAHLIELSRVVEGARIWDRESEQPVSCTQRALERMTRLEAELTSEINEISEVCSQYTKAINWLTRPEQTEENQDVSLRSGRLRDELTNLRQYLLYLGSLQGDSMQGISNMRECDLKFEQEINSLKHMLTRQISNRQDNIPRDLVHRQFHSLSTLFGERSEELRHSEAADTLFRLLQKHKKSFTPTLDRDLLAACATHNTVDTAADVDDHRVQRMMDDVHQPQHLPPDSSDLTSLRLEYQGFCPWTLLKRDSLLLYGDVKHGVVMFDSKYYAFCQKSALSSFMANPRLYIDGIIQLAKQRPELVQLLGIQENFKGSALSALIAESGVHPLLAAPRQLRDADVQTPTHFVTSNIDQAYKWNEWDLRRQALHLVDLRNKKTHSMQTDQSHFRRENVVQVNPPRDAASQTNRDMATTMARKQNIITGLRGKPEQRMKVVSVEFDLDEKNRKKVGWVPPIYN
eukprot:gnl/Hemi2/23977_TR8042_c0_g1_i1.p1 gnl/Hemi2/23977_TR8042_c0_g1~~gnl/Hemi2/23977_TR8042_c0_g1_i1.p1  ORF type:complete len:640 (-),score=188.82 gnl/Hemi2/23977_TR8042_c0_g1_i1:216-2135(-)